MLKKLIAMQKRIMDTAKAEKRELNEGEQRDFNLLQSLIDNIRSEENNGQGNAKPTENQGEQPTEPEGARQFDTGYSANDAAQITSLCRFQLTRSAGSVTLHIVYVKSHHHNRADILLKITLKSDIFYIICIIFSANLHIKPISLHVRSQNQTALRIICFLCTYMLHSLLPIITQIIESKAILFFINNFHKSIF